MVLNILRNLSKRAVNEQELEEIIQRLKEEVVFVEGKRDVEALERLGIQAIPIVGRVESAILKANKSKQIVLLMDLDRKGNELAERTNELLWSKGVKVDCESRRKLGRILRVKYFEELDRKYDEYMQKSM